LSKIISRKVNMGSNCMRKRNNDKERRKKMREMIQWPNNNCDLLKNMLKRRKESNTNLATIRGHRWSAQMTMKKDNLLELSASTVTFIS
jgi:hypothetical protein